MMETTKTKTSENTNKTNSVTQILVPVLGLLGIGISGYLTYVHYQNLNAVCLFNAKCDTVLTSPYSQIWGIPLSLFGLLMYLAITILGFLYLRVKNERAGLLAVGLYGLALASLLFSLYLYYLEIFEIHAFCTWCIASSIVVLCLFILSLVNLSKSGFRFGELPHFVRTNMKRYVQW